MVCDKCSEKIGKVCVPDKWKDGARNTVVSGGIKAGKTNKALARLKANETWLPSERNCRLCRSKVLKNMNYCNDCAHVKGICAMCGRKAVDTSGHKMSLV